MQVDLHAGDLVPLRKEPLVVGFINGAPQIGPHGDAPGVAHVVGDPKNGTILSYGLVQLLELGQGSIHGLIQKFMTGIRLGDHAHPPIGGAAGFQLEVINHFTASDAEVRCPVKPFGVFRKTVKQSFGQFMRRIKVIGRGGRAVFKAFLGGISDRRIKIKRARWTHLVIPPPRPVRIPSKVPCLGYLQVDVPDMKRLPFLFGGRPPRIVKDTFVSREG